MRRAIISYANGPEWYPCQDRQRRFMWNHWDIGREDSIFLCRPGRMKFEKDPTLRCDFKVHALVWLSYYFDMGIWMDSSAWPVADVQPLWDIIETDGYLFLDSGFMVGNWMSDAALDVLGISRDDVMEMESISGGLIGLDFRKPHAGDLLDKMQEYIQASFCYKAEDGAWIRDNKDQIYSTDPRCKGMRQQAYFTYIINNLGMDKRQHYGAPSEDVMIKMEGPITNNTIILFNGAT